MASETTTAPRDDFANFMALLPFVLWMAEPSGRVVQAGAAWASTAGPLQVQDWASAVHPEDAERTKAAWSASLASGQPYDIEHRIRGKSGRYVWVRTRAKVAKGSDGQFLRWYGSSENIDDRKTLELKLQAERLDTERKLAELEVLYRTAPIGLAVFDKDLRFVRVNDALAAMNGVPADEHIGKTPSEVVPDLAPQATALLQRILDTGEAQLNIEIAGETPAEPGCTRTWLESWQPILGKDGVPDGLSIVAVDITERKRLEAALQDDKHRKARFLAMVAHELRNALAPAQHAIQLLKALSTTGRTDARPLSVLERSCGQLSALVDDLSELSDTDATRIPLSIAPISAGELLEDVASSAREMFERRQQSLHVSPCSNDLRFDGDRIRLQQVLFNLLSNASKYTADGGTIVLSAACDGETVVFRVQDCGIGIEPDRLEQVFELFSRGDHPWHLAVGGLGIGLAIVKRFVEAHGGTVTAVSGGPGQGSEFQVRLPCSGAQR